MPIYFLTNMFLLFLLATYLDITFCVLKFGGKSSLLCLLAIIGFCYCNQHFWFHYCTDSHKRVFLYYGIMPVDIKQWCAEIGDFNGYSQLSVVKLYLHMCDLMNTMFLVLICTFALSVCCIKFYFFSYLTKVLSFLVLIFFLPVLGFFL